MHTKICVVCMLLTMYESVCVCQTKALFSSPGSRFTFFDQQSRPEHICHINGMRVYWLVLGGLQFMYNMLVYARTSTSSTQSLFVSFVSFVFSFWSIQSIQSIFLSDSHSHTYVQYNSVHTSYLYGLIFIIRFTLYCL